MFLSIATTHQPATDLGYLLRKHPGRLHEIEQTFGKAWVFYPDATDRRCEAVLVLDVDPVGLVRHTPVRLWPPDRSGQRRAAASSFAIMEP